ncbi:MAG: hypothetical protein JJU19_13055 [Pararhodobacter sp.]|nr:hypothetical protein [Pararhodobacter sp.]
MNAAVPPGEGPRFRMADLMRDAPARIEAMIAAEIDTFDTTTPAARATLDDFLAHRIAPEPVEVQFSGGIYLDCFAVTRSNGRYTVVWLPLAGYFALCVDGQFGPLDIGVHGPAIAVFSSV